MTGKAFTLTILVMFAFAAILLLCLRAEFALSPSDVHKAAPASRVTQQEEQSRFASGVPSAVNASLHRSIDLIGMREEVENVNAEPSGVMLGQLTEAENGSFDQTTAGVLPAGMEAESSEHTQTPETEETGNAEAEDVNGESSGVMFGQLTEGGDRPLSAAELSGAGVISQ